VKQFIFVFFLIFHFIADAKPAQRIIALSPHAVELLYAIGAGDRIVGTVEYADYPEEAKKIPRIGNYTGIQLERVLELKPDLIVAWRTGNKDSDLKKMESLGLKLFYTHPQSIKEIKHDLAKLGELIGLSENADKVIADLEQKYQAILKRYKNKRAVKVFYQMWHDPIRTVGPNSWVESLIADCNGENVFNDAGSDYPLVSLESVLIKDPEVIIIPHHSGNIGAKKSVWDNWQTINAVKHNRLFVINGDILHRFAPRAIEGLEQLCQAIDSAREPSNQ
jgi:vitamin B12 transport system substrate-binding protein